MEPPLPISLFPTPSNSDAGPAEGTAHSQVGAQAPQAAKEPAGHLSPWVQPNMTLEIHRLLVTHGSIQDITAQPLRSIFPFLRIHNQQIG